MVGRFSEISNFLDKNSKRYSNLVIDVGVYVHFHCRLTLLFRLRACASTTKMGRRKWFKSLRGRRISSLSSVILFLKGILRRVLYVLFVRFPCAQSGE